MSFIYVYWLIIAAIWCLVLGCGALAMMFAVWCFQKLCDFLADWRASRVANLELRPHPEDVQ